MLMTHRLESLHLPLLAIGRACARVHILLRVMRLLRLWIGQKKLLLRHGHLHNENHHTMPTVMAPCLCGLMSGLFRERDYDLPCAGLYALYILLKIQLVLRLQGPLLSQNVLLKLWLLCFCKCLLQIHVCSKGDVFMTARS